jgi:hypothetical protein
MPRADERAEFGELVAVRANQAIRSKRSPMDALAAGTLATRSRQFVGSRGGLVRWITAEDWTGAAPVVLAPIPDAEDDDEPGALVADGDDAEAVNAPR